MMIKTMVLATCLLGLAACGSKSSGDKAPEVHNYVVNGDPNLILQGAEFRPESPFDAENIKSLEDYSLLYFVSYSEREKPVEEKSGEEVKKENAPSEGRKDVSYAMKVVRQDNSNYSLDVGTFLSFQFKNDSHGKLQITSFDNKKNVEAVQVLHWSLSEDKKMLIVLIGGANAEDGKSIGAFYFRKSGESKSAPILEKIYRYLAGPGVGVRWDTSKELQVQVCGDNVDFALSQSGIEQWKSAIGGGLNIKLTRAQRFKPFSDLNQRCIYAVDLYYSKALGASGVAMTILDLSRSEIIDSDIIIFNKTFEEARKILIEKYDEGLTNTVLTRLKSIVYTHEIGHLLGLAHQFDGTQSVMSYEYDTTALTRYDRQAIQALYPTAKTSQISRTNARK